MYFITCFQKDGTEKWNGKPDFGDMRTFGYLESFEEAEKALNENWCDMFECLYRYAVVERINPGKVKNIICESKDRKWFQYDVEKDGFFQLEEPIINENVPNFAFC